MSIKKIPENLSAMKIIKIDQLLKQQRKIHSRMIIKTKSSTAKIRLRVLRANYRTYIISTFLI